MAGNFNPYYEWLGIPLQDQPPNHYRLLGLERPEHRPQAIVAAAQRQTLVVAVHQTGPQAAAAQQLLQEIADAQTCLLDPAAKAVYDAKLTGIKAPRPAPRRRSDPSAAAPWRENEGEDSADDEDAPGWLYPALLVGGAVCVALLLAMAVAVIALRRPPAPQETVAIRGDRQDRAPTVPDGAQPPGSVPQQPSPRRTRPPRPRRLLPHRRRPT
jgi:hypothetical protein